MKGWRSVASKYFSDREGGPKPRVLEEIPQNAWGGIVAAIQRRVNDGSFGNGFPRECPDKGAICGCDESMMGQAIQAEIPDVSWPLREFDKTPTMAILDLVEFCHRAVAHASVISTHSYFHHNHYRFDQSHGQSEFRDEINRIFERNGIAYELGMNGQITRTGAGVPEGIKRVSFNTGDSMLDALLEVAQRKFLDPDPTVRREGLEKLWDAWERLKTVEPGKDKKEQIGNILDKAASEPVFRSRLDVEAKALTDIGNQFLIRHAETNQVPLQRDEHVDYMFHRMFAIVFLLLRMSSRIGIDNSRI